MVRVNEAKSSQSKLYAVVGMLVVVVTALVWQFRPRPVELSTDTYDLAIALYRVCNQQHEQGLDQIQARLDELGAAADSNDAAITHLQWIIDEAESGDWKSAMRHTRDALDDQTNRI